MKLIFCETIDVGCGVGYHVFDAVIRAAGSIDLMDIDVFRRDGRNRILAIKEKNVAADLAIHIDLKKGKAAWPIIHGIIVGVSKVNVNSEQAVVESGEGHTGQLREDDNTAPEIGSVPSRCSSDACRSRHFCFVVFFILIFFFVALGLAFFFHYGGSLWSGTNMCPAPSNWCDATGGRGQLYWGLLG